MKKSAILLSTIIITASLTVPTVASASENKIEAKTTLIQYFISLFSPAQESLVVRPKKPKLAL